MALEDAEKAEITEVYVLSMQDDLLVTVDLRAFDLKGVKKHVMLHHEDVKAVNTEAHPDNVAPVSIQGAELKDGVRTVKLPALSWNVIRLAYGS